MLCIVKCRFVNTPRVCYFSLSGFLLYFHFFDFDLFWGHEETCWWILLTFFSCFRPSVVVFVLFRVLFSLSSHHIDVVHCVDIALSLPIPLQSVPSLISMHSVSWLAVARHFSSKCCATFYMQRTERRKEKTRNGSFSFIPLNSLPLSPSLFSFSNFQSKLLSTLFP